MRPNGTTSTPELTNDTAPRARILAAIEQATKLNTLDWHPRGPSGVQRERWVAIGDPQASLEKFMSYLEVAGLLGDEGMLRPEVGLVAMGDYFDWSGNPGERAVVAREGRAILRWLVEHAPDQVIVLLGNHDLARVIEFESIGYGDDLTFAAVSEEATSLLAQKSATSDEEYARAERDFLQRFPWSGTVWLVGRDYSGFSLVQRSLVRQVLMARRGLLAVTATLPDGTKALLSHAGVTKRELDILGLAHDAQPELIAKRLREALEAAVRTAERSWRAGRFAPLSLAPLYPGAQDGIEAGGLLYHRPANRAETTKNLEWKFDVDRPRRFDPPSKLPRGLVQVCGHTGHGMCVRELGSWVTSDASAAKTAAIRTLSVRGSEVRYELGVSVSGCGADDAVLVLIDPEMQKTEPRADSALSLESVDIPRQSMQTGDEVWRVIDPGAEACAHCKHMFWMSALWCRHERNRGPDGKPMALPNLGHSCPAFERGGETNAGDGGAGSEIDSERGRER